MRFSEFMKKMDEVGVPRSAMAPTPQRPSQANWGHSPAYNPHIHGGVPSAVGGHSPMPVLTGLPLDRQAAEILNWKLNTAKYVVHWYEAGKHNQGNPSSWYANGQCMFYNGQLYAHKSWLDEFSHTAQQYLAQAGIIGSQMTPIPVPNPKAGVPNQPPMVQIPAVPVNIEVANKQLRKGMQLQSGERHWQAARQSALSAGYRANPNIDQARMT
jgi:hypothetical protein